MDEIKNKRLLSTLGLLCCLSVSSATADNPTTDIEEQAPRATNLRTLLGNGWNVVTRKTPRSQPLASQRKPTGVTKPSGKPHRSHSGLVKTPLQKTAKRPPLVVIATPEQYPRLHSIQTVPSNELVPFVRQRASFSDRVTGVQGPSPTEVDKALKVDGFQWKQREPAERLQELAREHGFGLLSTDK